MNTLTPEQMKLLNILLTKYEKSKTCFGENKVQQRFKCRPSDVYQDYYSDYIDVDDKARYDSEINELEKLGYITVERKHGDATSVIMINQKYGDFCTTLGLSLRFDNLEVQRTIFKRYKHRCPLLNTICTEQLERIDLNKDNSISTDISELERMLECIAFIANNNSEILERELSIAVFSDSKMFENKYKSKVCNIMLKYENGIDLYPETDKKVLADFMLSEHCIVKNPSYIFFKGNGIIEYSNGYSITLIPEIPVAINTHTITDIRSITISDSCIMTVENLTSYNRLQSKDTFMLYLSGYSNTSKNNILKLISLSNLNKEWFHYGDIDPDGFHILENLRNKTKIDFQPFNMGISELIKYRDYTKRLEENDKKKAVSLIQSRYSEIIKYMLENNCKLEQEIISWKDPKNMPHLRVLL